MVISDIVLVLEVISAFVRMNALVAAESNDKTSVFMKLRSTVIWFCHLWPCLLERRTTKCLLPSSSTPPMLWLVSAIRPISEDIASISACRLARARSLLMSFAAYTTASRISCRMFSTFLSTFGRVDLGLNVERVVDRLVCAVSFCRQT